MSTYFTYGDIRTKVENDLILSDQGFISPEELLGYAKEAVREVEAEVHTINEDYFLSKTPLVLVNGQTDYVLPANIYAHKIRRLMYQNGSTIYTLDRLRDWRKFENNAIDLVYGAGNYYGYMIVNSTPGAPVISLSPPPREAGSFITIWYIREANQFVNDSSICDIPEFVNFVMQFMKVRCYEKQVGHPNLTLAVTELEQQRKQMNDTLTAMVPDTENTVEPDLTFYREMT